MKRPLGREGFSLLEIMIGAALLSFIIIAALSVDRISKQADARLNLVRSIEIIRQNFIDVLTTPEAFYNTIQASSGYVLAKQRVGAGSSPDMTCLNQSIQNLGSGLCQPTSFAGEKEPPFAPTAPTPRDTLKFWNYNWGLRPLIVKRADGTSFYDSTLPSSGFALDGTPCQDFDDSTDIGHSDCPLHFDFSWTIECSATLPNGCSGVSCTQCACPTVIVGARVIYHPGTLGPGGLNYTSIHPQQHGISALRISLDSWCGG